MSLSRSRNLRPAVAAGAALILIGFLTGCAKFGMVGSEDYQYFGGWGGQAREFVPGEVQRVQPWFPNPQKRATP